MKGFTIFCHIIIEPAKTAMKKEPENQAVLRMYLLGNLRDTAEMRRIEEQMLLDDDFFEKLSVAEDNLIEDYLDDNLTSIERERFDNFFLDSPERIQNLRQIKNLRKYAAQFAARKFEKPAREKRRFFDWRGLFAPAAVRFAVGALILAAAGFGIWRVGFYQSDTERGIAELHRSYRSQRPFEARLSNFDYAPFSETRGGDIQTDTETRARDGAARKLIDAAQNEPSAASFHALGNYYLTEKQFDKAITQFDAALAADPNNVRIYNDYGVALLEKAKQSSGAEQPGRRLENLARANDYFTKAAESDGALLEAVFNRAITLQLLKLNEESKKAWRDYLAKDSTSAWADEARRNLQELENKASAAKSPDQVRTDFFDAFERGDEERAWQIVSQTRETITGTMVFFQLIEGFLESDAARQTATAEQYLAALKFVGKMEKDKAGDDFFSELADFYAAADAPTRQISRQIRGQVKTGYQLSQSSKYSEAAAIFQQTEKSFAKTGDVWESKLSAYWFALLDDRTGKTTAANREMAALTDFCEKKNYKWLAAQSLGLLADASLSQNEFSKALNYLNAALKLAKETSDTYNQQKILIVLGDYYRQLGAVQKSLAQVEESLATEQNYFASDRQSWRSCLFAAEILYKLELYNPAISFGLEAQRTGNEKITEATADYSSYYTLALLYGGAGKYTEAIDFAQKSLASIKSAKPEDKRLLTDYSNLRTADLYRQKGDCDQSLKIYADVIAETAEQGADVSGLNNYQAHKGRLLCYFALGQSDLIEEELPVVLDLYEKFRTEIAEDQSRNIFFANEQNVYDLAVNFRRSQNEIQKAFDLVEISKARSLLDLFQTKTALKQSESRLNVRLNQAAEPLSLVEIQKRLPAPVQVVEYAVLPDKILIWIITPNRISYVEKPIAAGEITRQIENYLRISGKSELEQTAAADARQIYETLVTPALPFLDTEKEVCFIPDKSLYRLPFAALISPANNHFLIEDFTIFSAPSATMLILSSEAAAKFSGNEEKILSVGNPSFDKKEFPDLPDLPDAENEAVKVAAFYPRARTLTGKNADKKSITGNLNGSSVFHFAGHYAVNESSPRQSEMLLTKTKESDSAGVTADEILAQNPRSVKLAVLSACRTGIENYYNGEGMIGAARSFLADGVPLVVASQWAVDSKATAELMINFHRFRKQNRLSSAEALRRAQIEMLHNADQRFRLPYYWAAFLPIGGFTDY